MSASGRGSVCSRWAAVAAAVLLGTSCASTPRAVPALPGEEPLGADSGEDVVDDAAWEQDDRADDFAQLLAQAEANLQDGRALDDVRRDEIARWAEELRAAVEREATLLESGAAEDEIASAASDAAAASDGLRAALAAVADARGLDPADDGWGGSDPGVAAASGPPFLDRVVGLLDSALLALDRVHQIRSSLRAFSHEDGAPPGGQGWDSSSSWPAEALEEVSGLVTLDGEPVAGARVAEPTLGLETTTDAVGAYRLALPPRASRLVVTQGGRRVAEAPVHVRRGRGALADFDVRAGRRTSRARILPSDVAMRRQGAGPTGTIRAVVEDAKGRKLARTLVRLDGKAAARTDGEGRCLFRGVSSGPHRLTVAGSTGSALHSVHVQPSRIAEARIAVDAPPARAARPRPLPRPDRTASRRPEPRPSPRPDDTAARAPQPRPSPSPRVRSSGRSTPAPVRGGQIEGRVTSGGHPVAGAAVTVKGSSGHGVRSGRDGSYSIKVPAGGKYRVRVGKAGFEDEERSVKVGEGQRSTLSFDLRADGARDKARARDRREVPATKKKTAPKKPTEKVR